MTIGLNIENQNKDENIDNNIDDHEDNTKRINNRENIIYMEIEDTTEEEYFDTEDKTTDEKPNAHIEIEDTTEEEYFDAEERTGEINVDNKKDDNDKNLLSRNPNETKIPNRDREETIETNKKENIRIENEIINKNDNEDTEIK